MQLELFKSVGPSFFKQGVFGDKRLEKRGLQLVNSMLQGNTVVLNQLSNGQAELKAYSSLLRNRKVNPEDIIGSAISRCKDLVVGRHVLVINDTTQLNFERHCNYLDRHDEHLGPIGNNKDLGFFLHPGLVLDADQGLGLGFSYVKIWNRQYSSPDRYARNYQRLPIEKKESYRWIECGIASKQHLKRAGHITIIADRESDIYAEFVILPDEGTDLIIRSSQDRSLYGSDKRLYQELSESKCCGVYPLEIRANKKGKRKGRSSTMEVRFTPVKIQKPKGQSKSLADYVSLYAIEAKESSLTTPLGENPICWRLLTTHPVTNLKQAQKIITWYAMRWQIELLFGTLKSSGLCIEASELETGKGLKNLCLIAMQVALKINQLTQGREREDVGADTVFTKKEIVVLKAIQPQYEGRTDRQKNLYKPESLAWSAWIIARMGGWKSDLLQSKPGNKTMKIGLDKFNNICLGWYLKNTPTPETS